MGFARDGLILAGYTFESVSLSFPHQQNLAECEEAVERLEAQEDSWFEEYVSEHGIIRTTCCGNDKHPIVRLSRCSTIMKRSKAGMPSWPRITPPWFAMSRPSASLGRGGTCLPCTSPPAPTPTGKRSIFSARYTQVSQLCLLIFPRQLPISAAMC